MSGVSVEAGTSEEVTTMVQEGSDASSDQGDSNGGDEKWSDSGHPLKVQPTGFPNRKPNRFSHLECEV